MFIIVSSSDKPLYEKRFQFKKTQPTSQQVLNAQFALHASLDVLDEKLNTSKELFLKEIDTNQENKIYGFVTPTNIRFLIMTDQDEDKVKSFCLLVHEQLIKVLMNPLYELGTPITSLYFDAQLHQLISSKLNS